MKSFIMSATAGLVGLVLASEAQAGGYGSPRFHPGADGAWRGTDGLPGGYDGPVTIVEYREPYIGRGLLYNVPPDPYLARRSHVIRARS